MNDKKRAVITKNLENWYVVDSLLFNNHARSVIAEGSTFVEYVSLKASMLSNLYEYWNHVKYTPVKPQDIQKERVLQENAVNTAKHAKSLASNMMNKEKTKAMITEMVITEAKKRGVSKTDEISSKIIHEKFMNMAIDNALIGIPLLESRQVENSNDFKGQILEDAHRLMRENLVRLALTCKKKDS